MMTDPETIYCYSVKLQELQELNSELLKALNRLLSYAPDRVPSDDDLDFSESVRDKAEKLK